jgi:hypothetical protein
MVKNGFLLLVPERGGDSMKRLAAIVLVLPLWACASQSGGPFERAGRNADEVVEDVREGAEDVIEGVRETAEDVGDDVRRRRR